MHKISKEQKSMQMRAVRSSGSQIERKLLKDLWSIGLRYRKNDKTVLGKPDIVFKSIKLAVFCDGDFWHGKNWLQKKKEIKSNREFWFNKIEKNILRDKLVNRTLKNQGWKVLRFWGSEILKNKDKCIQKIHSEYSKRKQLIN